MKECNYCSEEIKNDAIKCRYCGKFIDEKENIEEGVKINKKLNVAQINRILIIIILFMLGSIALYLFNSNNNSRQNINSNTQKHILKSIVKIEYKDNLDEDWIGSGVMFSEDGLLLTNNHVIEDFETGKSDGSIVICILEKVSELPNCDYTGNLIIRNPALDLAIIKINNFTATDYIDLFTTNGVNTSIFGETINIYGYPFIGGNKITITKGIVSGFDFTNNIKTDAEINGGNSGGGAFLGNNFIGIPSSSMTSETSGKISFIISKNKIYSWLSSILKSNSTTKYTSSDFKESNLIYKGDNIKNTTSFDTPDYLNGEKVCKEGYGKNSYYSGEQSEDSYLCECNDGYDFGGDNYDTCIPIEYEIETTSNKSF